FTVSLSAFAVKHYLREEEASECDDVRPFISDIKSTLPGFENLKTQDEVENKNAVDNNTYKKVPSWNHILSSFSNRKEPHQRGKGKELEMESPNHNLPLEISLYISDYVTTQFREERIGVPISNNMLQNVNMLIECLSSFERILRTPIPLAYSIHLSQTVWIYCLSLPFQLVSFVGWSTIPIVFFASFILLGIERIAAEIENPFGYDPNDLDLDGFCEIIQRELEIIIKHSPPNVDHWVYDKGNLDAIENADNETVKSINDENS
ncbi:23859_t:CDS:2, partial [Dentiscutata erythropus]